MHHSFLLDGFQIADTIRAIAFIIIIGLRNCPLLVQYMRLSSYFDFSLSEGNLNKGHLNVECVALSEDIVQQMVAWLKDSMRMPRRGFHF